MTIMMLWRRSASKKRWVRVSLVRACCWLRSTRPVGHSGSSYRTAIGPYSWRCRATLDPLAVMVCDQSHRDARSACTRPSQTVLPFTFNRRSTSSPTLRIIVIISISLNTKVTTSVVDVLLFTAVWVATCLWSAPVKWKIWRKSRVWYERSGRFYRMRPLQGVGPGSISYIYHKNSPLKIFFFLFADGYLKLLHSLVLCAFDLFIQ